MHEEQLPDGVSAHAGFPNPALDTSLHGLSLNQLLIAHTASTFLFRIRGNEWNEQGIFDGDIALIDRALDPQTSDLVIWWRPGQNDFSISTCKHVPKESNLWGVVTSVIHQFRKINLT